LFALDSGFVVHCNCLCAQEIDLHEQRRNQIGTLTGVRTR
jgi:hypothetical protein